LEKGILFFSRNRKVRGIKCIPTVLSWVYRVLRAMYTFFNLFIFYCYSELQVIVSSIQLVRGI
jgi:hypothetical protein